MEVVKAVFLIKVWTSLSQPKVKNIENIVRMHEKVGGSIKANKTPL